MFELLYGLIFDFHVAIVVAIISVALYIVGKKLMLLNYKLKKDERQAEQAERVKQAELVRKAEGKSE